ncbi:MAG: hypothetical protein JSV65_06460 [Armatimonadota bacterium]|nr:MAG: hypothetical protein JSV65_06460 [Armatimonadota bacterium]
MRTKVLVLVVLGVLTVSAGAAWAQYGGYGAAAQEEKPFLRAKVGWFEPDESALDGDLAFGVDYIVPEHQGYLSIDRLHAEDGAAETTAWSIMGGIYRTSTYANREVYYGAGVGWSSHELKTPLVKRDDDGFAWEVGAGMNLSRTGFIEVKYRDGGEDGNTGFILFVGMSYE